jgi:hypothetical protein
MAIYAGGRNGSDDSALALRALSGGSVENPSRALD